MEDLARHRVDKFPLLLSAVSLGLAKKKFTIDMNCKAILKILPEV